MNFFTRTFQLSIALLILALFSQLAFGHGISDADKLSIIEGGNLRYMWLGATHMLSGYDHLAFVFGIIFFLTSFRDIAKYVTAFTLGHSVTLIFATFNAIQLNYFLIDAVIALSVCYIAFTNIDGFGKYLNLNPPNMMLMIVALGLIHGFGLSTRLQELPLSEDHLLLNIISFNIGIELGQISALALMLVVLAAWRKSDAFKTFSLLANYGLIALGSLLFLMQMHGYEHSAHSEEFNLTVDNTKKVSAAESIISEKRSESPSHPQWKESIVITIPDGDYTEYKLHLDKEATLNYTWESNGQALFFDFHGEPEGDTSGYFKSYNENTARQASGTLTAPFAGSHGWYWNNESTLPITITLKINGDYQRLDTEDGSID